MSLPAAIGAFLLHWLVAMPLNLLSRPKRLRIGGSYRNPPESGFRKWLYNVTEGRWNLGTTLRHREYEARNTIKAKRRSKCIVFSVLSFGGGQGKTTLAIKLAQLLQRLWPGVAVLVIDMNPSPGTLAERIGAKREDIQAFKDGNHDQVCWTLEDVARNVNELTSMAEIAYRFANRNGVFVLAGRTSSSRDKKSRGQKRFENLVKTEDFDKVMTVLTKYFGFIVKDGGTDPWNDATQNLMRDSDVLTVPTTLSDDRLNQVADLMATLQDEAYVDVRDRVVIVFNKVWWWRRTRRVERALSYISKRLNEDHGVDFSPTQVRIMPWSPMLLLGRTIDVTTMRRRVRVPAMEITAANVKSANGPERSSPASPSIRLVDPFSRHIKVR